MNFGLTETGFSLKRQPDVLDDLNAALAARFGSGAPFMKVPDSYILWAFAYLF
jgi:hypothetical protein